MSTMKKVLAYVVVSFLACANRVLVCDGDAHTLSRETLIIMISTPRSLSTAFFRMMQACCCTISEPGADAYFRLHNPEGCWSAMCESNMPRTYQEAVACIKYFLTKGKPVFVKEMGFCAREYLLLNGKDLIAHPKTYCIFLVRHPAQALISYYTMQHKHDISGADHDALFEEIMSYRILYELYEQLLAIKKVEPLIIMCDDLIKNASTVVETFFNYVHLPFSPRYLSWEMQHSSPSADHLWDVNTQKYGWFDKAFNSNSFFFQKILCDGQHDELFNEIESDVLRARYQNLYRENMIYYRLFQAKVSAAVKE